MLCNATINPLNGMLSYVEINHLCWSQPSLCSLDKLPFCAYTFAHRRGVYQRGETRLLVIQTCFLQLTRLVSGLLFMEQIAY